MMSSLRLIIFCSIAVKKILYLFNVRDYVRESMKILRYYGENDAKDAIFF